MSTHLKIIGGIALLLLTVVIYGAAVPALLSSKSDTLVGFGFILAVGWFYLGATMVVVPLMKNKKENK